MRKLLLFLFLALSNNLLAQIGIGIFPPPQTITGNAATATALESNPTDCSVANTYASAIDASANLTCTTVTVVNGLTVTASTGTFTVTNGKTFAVTNSMTLAGTDGITYNFPSLATNVQGTIQCTPGGTDSSTGLVAATINTTETAFATTYEIPANYLVANKTILVSWHVEELTSSSPVTQRIRVRIGGTGGASPTGSIVFDNGSALTPTVSLNNRGQVMQMLIVGTAAAGASVNVNFGQQAGSGITASPFGVANTIAQPVATVTNGALGIFLSVTFGGNTAGNSIKLHSMCVQALN